MNTIHRKPARKAGFLSRLKDFAVFLARVSAQVVLSILTIPFSHACK